MLLLQGINDHTIPRWPPDKDSNWWDGYIYASDFAVLKAYREHNHCFNPEPRGMDLPQKVQGESLSCTEYGYDSQLKRARNGHRIWWNAIYDESEEYNVIALTWLSSDTSLEYQRLEVMMQYYASQCDIPMLMI